MLAGWRCGAYFTLTIWATLGLAAVPRERFQESLIIRPLHDGKVSSQFSFLTSVKDATPRNPETLGLEDDCE
jgi:phosphatidylinositol glycan class T